VAEDFVFAGQTIAGKYRLDARLGRGGMGEVWRAEHLVLRAPVAVKFINPSLATSGDATGRFLREAQAAATLRSPHVVQILDYGVDEHLPFMVLEFLDGESLGASIARQGRLTPEETAHVMNHVARAMHRAHEAGIVHRDLKPENVFLVPTGDELIAKVLDFGIAKMARPDAMHEGSTRTGAVMGTPYYMSPEQVEGNKAVDYRTDIWAMGVIAFECLTGRRPFESETFGELVLKICMHPMPRPSDWAPVPPGFDAWFARAVNRNPADRFPSAREAAAALRTVCTGSSTPNWEASGPVAVPAAQLGQPAPVVPERVSADTAKPFSTTNRNSLPASLPLQRPGAALAVLFAVGATAALLVVGIVIVRNLGQNEAPPAPGTSEAEAPPAQAEAPTAEAPTAAPTAAPTMPPAESATSAQASAPTAVTSSVKPLPARPPPARPAPRPADKPPTVAPPPTTAAPMKPADML
jgi:serine/threonine-protein kinase